MARLFGTDGVRGRANAAITAELALDLAVAAAHVLGDSARALGKRPRAVVGRDPRASGEFLSSAVCAGLASAGVDVHNVGVLPTPAVAYLTADMNATFGVMLSASHNAMPDNGIKFFAAGGHKLPDAVEDEIEARLGQEWARPIGADVGRIHENRAGQARYVAHLLRALPHRLDGLTVVIDGAHGAASAVSPEVFRLAGADVVEIGTDPDGLNINDGYGSTHLDRLKGAVAQRDADLGIAHDGDADRCLAVDAHGDEVGGDEIMAILALALKERGQLREDTLVATVMSNLGLRRAMAEHGIRMVETAVGDRYVLEALGEQGLSLGGEQSGHVIMTKYATTGDGILTGLHLVAEMARTGKSLAELASVMTVYPQVLVNVRGVDHHALRDDVTIADAVTVAETALGDTGRVLLRPSGTEPMVRVMVEAEHQDTAQRIAQELADVVREQLAL